MGRMLDRVEWKYATTRPGEPSAIVCTEMSLLGYYAKSLDSDVRGIITFIVTWISAFCTWENSRYQWQHVPNSSAF